MVCEKQTKFSAIQIFRLDVTKVGYGIIPTISIMYSWNLQYRHKYCMFVSLQTLGTKGTLHPLPTLQNNEPIPQVLKQVVNLSCLLSG